MLEANEQPTDAHSFFWASVCISVCVANRTYGDRNERYSEPLKRVDIRL